MSEMIIIQVGMEGQMINKSTLQMMHSSWVV